jgi:hypothetical protein
MSWTLSQSPRQYSQRAADSSRCHAFLPSTAIMHFPGKVDDKPAVAASPPATVLSEKK